MSRRLTASHVALLYLASGVPVGFLVLTIVPPVLLGGLGSW